MPILAQCDQCGRRVSVKDEWAGRRVKCPGCGAAFTVPGGGGPAAPPPAPRRPQRAPLASDSAAYGLSPAPMPTANPPASAPTVRSNAAPPRTAPLAGKPLSGPTKKPPGKKRGKPRSAAKTAAQLAAGAAGLIVAIYACIFVAALIRSGGHPIQAALRADAEARREKDVPLGPVWSPNAQLLAQLGPEVTFDRYSWRVPAGYTPVAGPTADEAQGRAVIHAWQSTTDPPGKQRKIWAFIVDYRELPDYLIVGLEATMQNAIYRLQRNGHLMPFEGGEHERGQLAGRPFMRVRFTAQELPKSEGVAGAVLVSIEGNRLVMLQTKCYDTLESDTNQLLDAALLTFRDQSSSPPPTNPPAAVAAAPAGTPSAQLAPAQSAAPASPGNLAAGSQTWSPDASVVNLLGPEISFDRFGWRLPAGFTTGPTPAATAPPGFRAQNWLWIGAARGDGSRSVAAAFIVDGPQALDGADQLEAALAAAMVTFPTANGLAEFTSTPGEHGVVAGKRCIRNRFSGRIGAVTLRGRMLMFFEGKRLVGISVTSNEPEASTDQQHLEAALLTLRQR